MGGGLLSDLRVHLAPALRPFRSLTLPLLARQEVSERVLD